MFLQVVYKMLSFAIKKIQKSLPLFFVLLISAPVLVPYTHAEEEVWTYEMQPGDHIWKIAHELLTDWRSWQEVARFNSVQNDKLMAAGTVLRIPTSMIRERNADIQLIEVSGPVSLIRQNAETVPLSKAQSVIAGDLIKTGSQGSALIRFEDDTQVLLSQESELLINKASVIGSKKNVIDINVLLEDGEAEIRANPQKIPGSRFIIETPSAFATTRGTVYRVRATKDTTAAEVLQGKIQVANTQGSTQVKQTFGTLASKNKPPQKPQVLLKAPNLPELGTIRYLPARLSWNKVPQALNYRSQIAPSQTFDALLLDQLGEATKMNLPATLADGTYWLKVKAVDNKGLQGMDSIQSFTVDARPFPPLIQAPLSKTPVYTGDVEFSWAKPENVENFQFQLAKNETFAETLIDTPTVQTQSLTVPITEAGQYFWRVTSVSHTGKVGPVGHTNTIQVRPTPPTPELKAPATSDTELTLAWQKDEIAQTYEVQLAKDSDFKELVAGQTTQVSEASFPRPASGDYYMRVRGIDADNYAGGWTAPQKIEVPVKSYMPAFIWTLLSIAILL